MVNQKTVFNLNETISILESHKHEFNSVILAGIIERLNEEIRNIQFGMKSDGLNLWQEIGKDDLVDCPSCEEINELEFLEIVAGGKISKLYRCRQCGNVWEL